MVCDCPVMSLFHTVVHTLEGSLNSLKHIASLGQDYCEDKSIKEEALLSDRLFPDMLPLRAQYVIATDLTRRGMQRLIGIDPPSYPDVELSYASIIERIVDTKKVLAKIEKAKFENGPKEVTFKLRGEDVSFTQESYCLGFLLPNIYFHLTTAYDIQRKNGVPQGKSDYIKSFIASFS